MRLTRLSSLAALALTASLAPQVHADLVPGKGGNCSAVWDTFSAAATVSSTGKPSQLTCQDGDLTCDADRTVNGTCVINLNACVGQAAGTCTPGALTSLTFTPTVSRKLLNFVAPSATTPGCGTAGSVTLPLARVPKNPNKPFKRFKATGKSKALLVMKSKGFVDKLLVRCVPATQVVNCPPTVSGQPQQISFTTPMAPSGQFANGSDLDNGWTGTSHNFPVVSGSSLTYCLSGCDGTSTFECQGTGPTGAGKVNGPTFGAPLPLLAAGIPVCVVNRFQPGDLTGTFNIQTGQGGMTTPNLVPLFSDVYLRLGKSANVCPRCTVAGGGGSIGSVGKCDAESSTPGANCTVDGLATVQQGAPGSQSYTLSSSCTPSGGAAATLNIPLNLTTGTATRTGSKPCPDSKTGAPQTQDDSCAGGTCTPGACTGQACVSGSGANCVDIKGGISQACCSNSTSTPCFTTKNGGSITRTGTPATDGGTAVFATTFCIDATGSPAIDTTTGLPGPGALLLPGTVKLTKTP